MNVQIMLTTQIELLREEIENIDKSLKLKSHEAQFAITDIEKERLDGQIAKLEAQKVILDSIIEFRQFSQPLPSKTILLEHIQKLQDENDTLKKQNRQSLRDEQELQKQLDSLLRNNNDLTERMYALEQADGNQLLAEIHQLKERLQHYDAFRVQVEKTYDDAMLKKNKVYDQMLDDDLKYAYEGIKKSYWNDDFKIPVKSSFCKLYSWLKRRGRPENRMDRVTQARVQKIANTACLLLQNEFPGISEEQFLETLFSISQSIGIGYSDSKSMTELAKMQNLDEEKQHSIIRLCKALIIYGAIRHIENDISDDCRISMFSKRLNQVLSKIKNQVYSHIYTLSDFSISDGMLDTKAKAAFEMFATPQIKPEPSRPRPRLTL